jgi:predicted RNase H-like HicB family nuclease
MRYAIIIEKGKRNYSAYVPDVPGCIATGQTIPEVKQLIKEALEFHLEGMLLDGESVPRPGTDCGYVSINLGKLDKGLRERTRVTARVRGQ